MRSICLIISKPLGQLTCQYCKTILIVDFNLTMESNSLKNFMNTFHLEQSIKKPHFSCLQSHDAST